MTADRFPRAARALAAALLVASLGGVAAAETTLTGGRTATLKNKLGSEHDSAKLVFKGDPGLGTLADPRCAAGHATRATGT